MLELLRDICPGPVQSEPLGGDQASGFLKLPSVILTHSWGIVDLGVHSVERSTSVSGSPGRGERKNLPLSQGSFPLVANRAAVRNEISKVWTMANILTFIPLLPQRPLPLPSTLTSNRRTFV